MAVNLGSRYQLTYSIKDNNTKKLYLSRRRPLQLSSDFSDAIYTVVSGDLLWKIAGRVSVYNIPEYWWILADYNSIANIFQANFDRMEPGQSLIIPKLARVEAHLNQFG